MQHTFGIDTKNWRFSKHTYSMHSTANTEFCFFHQHKYNIYEVTLLVHHFCVTLLNKMTDCSWRM